MLSFGRSLTGSLRLVGHGGRLAKANWLHLSACNAVIKHARNENGYFKEIYSDDLQFPELDALFKRKRIVEDQSIVSFNHVVNTAEITNSNLIPYFQQFTEKLKDKEIASLIYVLNRLRQVKSKTMSNSVHHLLSFIDQSLADHLNKEKTITDDQFRLLFQIVLLFDEIGMQNWSQFNCRLAAKSLDNFHLFENKENLLRALYILNLSRKPINAEKAMLIELQVMKYFYHNELDLKEIGLVCMAFHKTQTKFRTPLMERVVEKLVDEIDQMHDSLCVASILKGVFSSEPRLDTSLIHRLGDKLQVEGTFDNDSNFLVLSKFFSILKKYRIYDERLIGSVLDSFAQQETVRIKELSRLLLNLLFFGVELNARQIGKFNEQLEKIKSNYAVYRVEYLLSVFALASHGLIRKEEIFNIYESEFINVIRSKHGEIHFFAINLNNILKLFGDSNYKDIAFKDRELLRIFANFESLSKSEVYARFKKFDRYPSKLYLCYQALREALEGRVHLVHLLPGCKYPQIVITPKKTILKDYPFEVAVNAGAGMSIVRIPGPELYCDSQTQRLSGYFSLEAAMLRKMGFRLFELKNSLISHTTSELRLYLKEQVLDNLDEPLILD